ncbi:MAG: ATP-binding cassette domain-containing protein, partial [Patescibacteria group bacterium]|nr:ATP-binding cassette domain-containing protein [Patescibacteria group bacterium]
MAEEKQKKASTDQPVPPTGSMTLGQAVQEAAPAAAAAIPEKKAVIRLIHVNKSFDLGRTVVHVLKDINIEIFPQEFIVILGPSGSGKSTVLNSLLGLEEPSSGEVYFRDAKITGLKQDKIAKLRYKTFGVVFQRSEWVRAM